LACSGTKWLTPKYGNSRNRDRIVFRYSSVLANDIGKYFVQKISRLREELDQGHVPNDQSYVLDDSDVNSDSTIPLPGLALKPLSC